MAIWPPRAYRWRMTSSWATASGPSACASASMSRRNSANVVFFMGRGYVIKHILSTTGFSGHPASTQPLRASVLFEFRQALPRELDLLVLALLAGIGLLVVAGEEQHDLVTVSVAVHPQQDRLLVALVRRLRGEHGDDFVRPVPQAELEEALTEVLGRIRCRKR